MLVKEHALPRVAWLRLSHVRAAWQELGARLREHQVRRTTHPSWWCVCVDWSCGRESCERAERESNSWGAKSVEESNVMESLTCIHSQPPSASHPRLRRPD